MLVVVCRLLLVIVVFNGPVTQQRWLRAPILCRGNPSYQPKSAVFHLVADPRFQD